MLTRSKIPRDAKNTVAKNKLNEKSSKNKVTKNDMVKPYNIDDTNIPIFIKQLWKSVNNKEINNLVSWSAGGNTFVVKNRISFANEVLPLYYRHNKFESFMKSLTYYSFDRIPSMKNRFLSDEIEFSHPYFKRNNPSLLKYFIPDRSYYKPIVTTKESDKRRKRCEKYKEKDITSNGVKLIVTLPQKRRTIILSRNRRRSPEGQLAETTIESNCAPPQGSVEDLFWNPIVGTSWQRVEEPAKEPPWELLTTPAQEHKPEDDSEVQTEHESEQAPTVEIEFIDMGGLENGANDSAVFNFGPDVEVVYEDVSSTLDPDIESGSTSTLEIVDCSTSALEIEDCSTSALEIEDCSTSALEIEDCSTSALEIEDCSTSAFGIEMCSSPAFNIAVCSTPIHDIEVCSSPAFDTAVCSTSVHDIEPTEIDNSSDVVTNATVELIQISEPDYSLINTEQSDLNFTNYNLMDPIFLNNLTVLDQ